ncbi:MAG: hypothetical protein JWN44_4423 [Myxococcales bacterium]|nr:hypothetical protein [Myxococcales bacterium]
MLLGSARRQAPARARDHRSSDAPHRARRETRGALARRGSVPASELRLGSLRQRRASGDSSIGRQARAEVLRSAAARRRSRRRERSSQVGRNLWAAAQRDETAAAAIETCNGAGQRRNEWRNGTEDTRLPQIAAGAGVPDDDLGRCCWRCRGRHRSRQARHQSDVRRVGHDRRGRVDRARDERRRAPGCDGRRCGGHVPRCAAAHQLGEGREIEVGTDGSDEKAASRQQRKAA